MDKKSKNKNGGKPKILVCTPELTSFPEVRGVPYPKGGGMADMTSALVSELKNKGVNVGVVIPHLKISANPDLAKMIDEEVAILKGAGISFFNHNLFLVENAYFSEPSKLYENNGILFSLAFQNGCLSFRRDFQPDLIHTHDWMTGLLPPTLKGKVKSLHTVHNFHTGVAPIDMIKAFNIDVNGNERHLYLREGYDKSRVDFQLSGIFGSDFTNTPSKGWLEEIVSGDVPENSPWHFNEVIRERYNEERVFAIQNAPDPSYYSETDSSIFQNFDIRDISEGKRINKKEFQKKMGLQENEDSPLIVWTNRADPIQKGVNYLNQVLPLIMNNHRNPALQIAIIADGPFIPILKQTIRRLENAGFRERISITGFSDQLERQAYASGDALLNFSLYAPCELIQMKGSKYGCVPIVRRTGGLKDSVIPFDQKNGFGFMTDGYNTQSLYSVINEFLKVYHSPRKNELPIRAKEYANKNFNVEKMAKSYIEAYSKILETEIV